MISKQLQPWRLLGGIGRLSAASVLAVALLQACGSGENSDVIPAGSVDGSAVAKASESTQPQRSELAVSDAQASTAAAAQAIEGVEPLMGAPEEVERNRGGDNSIQDYGDEASESDRRDAAAVLTTYLRAVASGNTDTACALFSAEGAAALADAAASLASRAGAPQEVEGCPDALSLMSQGGSAKERKAIAKPRVLSVRLDGESAFAIYAGAGGTQLAISMAKTAAEGWRLASVAGSPIG